MSNTNSVVAVFESHDQAEAAIRELQKDGFDMKKLSIVGKDFHTEEHVVGYYTTGDRMLYWGKLGAFWGGFWGLLLGSAFFWVPGVGQLLVAGPLVMWIVGALEGAVVIPSEQRPRFARRFRADQGPIPVLPAGRLARRAGARSEDLRRQGQDILLL